MRITLLFEPQLKLQHSPLLILVVRSYLRTFRHKQTLKFLIFDQNHSHEYNRLYQKI